MQPNQQLTERQAGKKGDHRLSKKTAKQAGRQTDSLTQTDRQTDRWVDRERETWMD